MIFPAYDSALSEGEQKAMSTVLLNKPAATPANPSVSSVILKIEKMPATVITHSETQILEAQNIRNLFSGAYIHTLNLHLTTK